MKIVVAEDDELILRVVEHKLKKEGIGEVFTAKDGKEALKLIHEKTPDIIITDMLMPYVSGLEIIHFVRQQNNSDIPIIVLSAVDLDEGVIEAFEAGADDFMTKPFNPSELIMRIKKIMIRRK